MNNRTIGDIYAANNEIHEKTRQLISSLTAEQTAFLPDGQKWTIAEIIEHIAIVKDGITKISAKLLAGAQATGKTSDGKAILSENFSKKALEICEMKLEAPDRVHPTGNQSIEESLVKLDESQNRLEELRPLFESVDCADFKFPHPLMGDLTAHEWLALVGGHEARHLQQIKNILASANA